MFVLLGADGQRLALGAEVDPAIWAVLVAGAEGSVDPEHADHVARAPVPVVDPAGVVAGEVARPHLPDQGPGVESASLLVVLDQLGLGLAHQEREELLPILGGEAGEPGVVEARHQFRPRRRSWWTVMPFEAELVPQAASRFR